MLNGFKLVANVDEYYISKVDQGINGITNVDSETYSIEIKKIYPEVVQGKFKIEMQFNNDSILKNIKRGMSLNTKVFLSNNSKALLVDKGQFYNNTNGQWVFVLNNNNVAVKRSIKIGRENPYYYEVLEGLYEGDKIITSSYDDFEDVEEININ